MLPGASFLHLSYFKYLISLQFLTAIPQLLVFTYCIVVSIFFVAGFLTSSTRRCIYWNIQLKFLLSNKINTGYIQVMLSNLTFLSHTRLYS